MKKLLKNRWVWIIVVLVLILGSAGVYAYSVFGKSTTQTDSEPQMQTAVANRGDIVIFASGTGSVIPTTEFGVGFQESGTLSELLIKVGEKVEAGQVLARLQTNNSEESLAASQASARLNYLNAQKNLQDIQDSWQTDVAQALLNIEDAQANLELMQNPELRQAQALLAIADAQQAVEDAQVTYNRTQLTASQANIDNAYADMIIARNNYERAQERFAHYADKPEDNVQRAQAQSSLSAAEQAYYTAAANYNASIGTASDTEKASAEANLLTAQAQLVEAQREYERIQNGSTPGEIALAEAQLSAAKTAWEKIKDGPDADEIAIAEAQLANAQAQLALAEEEQVTVDLLAPINGTVTSIDASVGEQVSTGTLVTLADLEQPMLEIFLDETDLDKVSVGYEIDAVFDAFPDITFKGSVVQVDPSLSKVNNITAVRALATLNPDSFAKPINLPVGLTASVDVIGGRATNAVLVPVEALRELSPGEYAVFVVVNGEPQLRVVEVGLMDFTSAEILSGVNPGDVVTTGIVATE